MENLNSMDDFLDGETLLKIDKKIKHFKSLIRESSNTHDEQSTEDLLTVLQNNTELSSFITSSHQNATHVAYKTLILKKINDAECLNLQAALNSQALESIDEDSKSQFSGMHITNTNVNLQIFQSQTRKMFQANHNFINKLDTEEFTDNTATFLIITNSTEAPNFKIMCKNFLNNLLQQFVFEDNPNLYETTRFQQDVYKLYIDNDGTSCRSFIDRNHIDLDMGLEGLKYAGDMVSELLNCKISKVRIFCYFEDINNYIPGVLDEFFTNLQDTLTDIQDSPYVQQEFEFINIFDGQASNHNLTESVFSEKLTEEIKYEVFSNSLCLNLIRKGDNTISTDKENSKGEFHVVNHIFLKLLEVMEWNIVLDANVVRCILEKLEFFIDRKDCFSFLEGISIGIIINFFQKALSCSSNGWPAILTKCHLDIPLHIEPKSLHDDVLNEMSFRELVEKLIETGSTENIEFCKNILTNEDLLMSEFTRTLYKATPKTNKVFKDFIHMIEKSVDLDTVNIIDVYVRVLEYASTKDESKFVQYVKNILENTDQEDLKKKLNESLEISIYSSDLLLPFKTINEEEILEIEYPNYRKHFQNISYLNTETADDEPLILVAYSVLMDYYEHLDIPLKIKDLYNCYKYKMIERLGDGMFTEEKLAVAFILVINMMLYSGYYNFDKWTLLKQVINGL
ncbi:unnamed protein product [Hanseniaspora opuntiae]